MTANTRRKHRRRSQPETALSPEEQDELALKLNYGVGLEHLVGPDEASRIRRSRRSLQRWTDDHQRIPRPVYGPSLPDHLVRARAAALGVHAGTRGQWLRR